MARICVYEYIMCIIIYIRIVFPTGISICFVYRVRVVHSLYVARVEENIHYAIIQRMLLGSGGDIHGSRAPSLMTRVQLSDDDVDKPTC